MHRNHIHDNDNNNDNNDNDDDNNHNDMDYIHDSNLRIRPSKRTTNYRNSYLRFEFTNPANDNDNDMNYMCSVYNTHSWYDGNDYANNMN